MPTKIAEVTDADFESSVLQSGQPVLVDFWATWCAPCRMIAPVVEQVADELGDRVKVVKMDIDANRETQVRLGVMSVPTLIIFKDGQPAERMVGYRAGLKGDLTEKLQALA